MKKEIIILVGSITAALVFGWIGGLTINTNEIFSAICVVLAVMSSLSSLFSAVAVLARKASGFSPRSERLIY
jgi:hypothetical protein